MSYAQQQDMIDRFGTPELVQLTDTTGSGQINVTVLQAALDDGSDEMDSYIGVRTALPLATVPPVLVRTNCDMARYRLYDQASPAEITARYTACTQWLTQLAKGIVTLGLPVNAEAPTVGNAQVVPTVLDRVFTSDTLSDYTC